MKLSIYRYSVVLLSVFGIVSAGSAQVTSSRSDNNSITQEVVSANSTVNKVLEDSGKAFLEALLAYKLDNRELAEEKFDKSVTVFLESSMNVQSQPILDRCFDKLIETVYQIEIPSEKKPQLDYLALECKWNWQSGQKDLAKEVVQLVSSQYRIPLVRASLEDALTRLTAVQASVKKTGLSTGDSDQKALNQAQEVYEARKREYDSLVSEVTKALPSTVGILALNNKLSGSEFSGFDSQKFEPAIGDELATVQLTPDEEQVDANPVAQQQFEYIQTAVANKSLGFSFQVHPMIQQYINYYRGRGRQTMEVGLYRSGMFMRMARKIFREESVPENVAWLGQVESAWKPSALSWAAASGLWQFIPGTGARYGLRRTSYVDERNSFDEATRASARYLKFLYNRYGNWELAIAGYNCGEGNVDRAIRRAGVSNFWAAYPYLPQETRNYVPNILATILIANNPNQFGFGHIRPAAPLQYDRIRVPASTNLSLLAQAADTSVQYLRYLNPHLRSNTTPPEPYIVNVPTGKADEVVALFRRVPANQIQNSNLANTAVGETWQNISNRTGVSVADLMAANPGMSVPKGKVFVPTQVKGAGLTLTGSSRPTNLPSVQSPLVRKVKVGLNDTITTIAEREKVTPKELALFNGLLIQSKLSPGRELRIPPSAGK